MRPRLIVIGSVFRKDSSKVLDVEHERMIRALAPDRARLFIRHIRKFDKFASVRERDPRVSHARIVFTLLRVVCFLCKRLAFSGRFPCGFAFGSQLIFPVSC